MLPLHSLSTLFPYTTLFRSFGPAEYKVFEDDPMHLFTKTGVRISANMRYNPQPWRTPRYMHTHIISANYGFLRRSEERRVGKEHKLWVLPEHGKSNLIGYFI